MKTEWKIPVSWSVCGFLRIEADTLEEAAKIAIETQEECQLPDDDDYLDGSFQIDGADGPIVDSFTIEDVEYFKTFN